MPTDRDRHVAARRRWESVLGLALVLSACRGSAVEPARERSVPAPSSATSAGDVLARFDGRVLTLREFEERLASEPPSVRAQFATVEARQKLLEDMVRLELLADEARRRGIDRSPRVRVRISELIVEEMMSGLFGSEAAEASKITDEEVRNYYDAHAAEFRIPEERRATDIVLGDRQKAEAVLRQVSAHAGDEAFFRQRAREQGEDPEIRARSGDRGFFSEASSNGPDAKIREAIFRMQRVGDIGATVVESDGRFHVLMLTGIRPGLVRSLTDVQTLVRARLTQEKRRAAIAKFTDDLRVRAHTEIHGERLGVPAAVPSAAKQD